MILKESQIVKKMAQTFMYYLKFEWVSTKFTQSSNCVQLFPDVFDSLEIIIFLKRNCEWNVVFHLSEVLNWTRVRVMIKKLPFVTGILEGTEAW